MNITINTEWLKVLNSPLFKKDFNIDLNDLFVWHCIEHCERYKIPAYRSIISTVLGESERTISRRFKKLANLGLITYKFYGGIMHIGLSVNPVYDFNKFDAKLKKLNGETNIQNLFNEVYAKMKGGNFNE